MSDEPTYEYVKGQGWVVASGRIFTYHGKRYRFETRLPGFGEQYVWHRRGRHYQNMGVFEDDGVTLSFDYYVKKTVVNIKTRNKGHIFATEGSYATLVPLD